jgi:excisionase family DNA binding protein
MLLSKKELAKSLGVSTKTIERKINEGLIPYYKIGSVIRFDENSINELLKHCRYNAKKLEACNE